jgi:hypothetical protein
MSKAHPASASQQKEKTGFLGRIREKIGDAATAAIAGVIVIGLGFVARPLGEGVLDLYPDNGKIGLVNVPDELLVGQEFTVGPRITPVGKLWHAFIEIKPRGVTQTLRQSKFFVGKVTEEGVFSPLQFKAADSEGTAHIEANLLSDDRPLASAKPVDIPIVRHREYAGDWQMKLGDTTGSMHLEETPDDDAAVYGFYKLSTETYGLISAKFDGAKLNGFLTIGDASTRIQILGDTHDKQGTISVDGEGTLYQAEQGSWQPMAGQQPLKFQMSKSKTK